MITTSDKSVKRKIFIPAGIIFIFGTAIIFYFMFNKSELLNEHYLLESFIYHNGGPRVNYDFADRTNFDWNMANDRYISCQKKKSITINEDIVHNIGTIKYVEPYRQELIINMDTNFCLVISIDNKVKYKEFVSLIDYFKMNLDIDSKGYIDYLLYNGNLYTKYNSKNKQNWYSQMLLCGTPFVNSKEDNQSVAEIIKHSFLDIQETLKRTSPVSYILLTIWIIYLVMNIRLIRRQYVMRSRKPG